MARERRVVNPPKHMQTPRPLKRVPSEEVGLGRYLVIPINMKSLSGDPDLWVVDTFEELGFICYRHPDDGEARVIKGSGYSFYKMPTDADEL